MRGGPGAKALARCALVALVLCAACRDPKGRDSAQQAFIAEAASQRPAPPSSAPPAPSVSTGSGHQESWHELEPGLAVRSWSVNDSVRAQVARAKLDRWEVVSVLAASLGASQTRSQPDADSANGAAVRSGPPRFPLSRYAQATGARVAVNGGFFDEHGAPIGLRIGRGRLLQPAWTRDWGVFFVRDGRPGQVHTRELAQAQGAQFAIQCGPRLVQDGVALRLKPGRHRRTAIGSTPTAEVVLLATAQAVELSELAQALARPISDGGLGLQHALNLDGGPSTQLLVRGKNALRWSVGGLSRVADAVVVVPRGAPLLLDGKPE
jgi:hypothetical protein